MQVGCIGGCTMEVGMKIISTVMICLLVVVNAAIARPLQDVPESNPDQTADEESAPRAAISDNGWILKVPHVRSIKMFHLLDEATRQSGSEILVVVDTSANVTAVGRQLPSALEGVPVLVVSQQQSSQVQQREDQEAEDDACWAAVDNHKNELTKPHVYSSNAAHSERGAYIAVHVDKAENVSTVKQQVPTEIDGFPVDVHEIPADLEYALEHPDHSRDNEPYAIADRQVQAVCDDPANKWILKIPHVDRCAPYLAIENHRPGEEFQPAVGIMVDYRENVDAVKDKVPSKLGGFPTEFGVDNVYLDEPQDEEYHSPGH
jgi:hypothetical protein